MSKSKSIRILPSVEYLRECFDYDPRTGELKWKVRPRGHFVDDSYWRRWNHRYAGMIAGTTNSHTGYRFVGVDHYQYYIHRIIFKLKNGEEPAATIDHADGDKTNNRWINLRNATQLNQRWNKRYTINNISGKRGVDWDSHKRKWRARIKDHGVERWLGYFDDIGEASVVYDAAARKLHGRFYRKVTK